MVLLILTSHGKNTNMDLANWKVSMCSCQMLPSLSLQLCLSQFPQTSKKETALIIYE